MPTRAPRSSLRTIAPLLLAGTFALAANAAIGAEPGGSDPIPDSAFRAVQLAAPASSLPTPASGFVPAPARTPDLSTFEEAFAPTPPPARAKPSLPPARPIVVAKAPKTTHSISGTASWYCRAGQSPCTYGHSDVGGVQAYAAAGPRLRAAIGSSWRGRIITVNGMRVQLIDWCQCYQGQSTEKLLDLYYDVYSRTGSRVVVRW